MLPPSGPSKIDIPISFYHLRGIDVLEAGMFRLPAGGRYPPRSLWLYPLRYQHPSPASLDGETPLCVSTPRQGFCLTGLEPGCSCLSSSGQVLVKTLLPVFFFRPISTVPVPCHAMPRTLEKLIVTELPKTGLDWPSRTIWPPT